VHEGIGLTESAPVVSTNLPDPPKNQPETQSSQPIAAAQLVSCCPARRPKYGIRRRTELLSTEELGMLWLKGPNVFEGYLNEPTKTAEVLKDGWFKPGDLADSDEDGFLVH